MHEMIKLDDNDKRVFNNALELEQRIDDSRVNYNHDISPTAQEIIYTNEGVTHSHRAALNYLRANIGSGNAIDLEDGKQQAMLSAALLTKKPDFIAYANEQQFDFASRVALCNAACYDRLNQAERDKFVKDVLGLGSFLMGLGSVAAGTFGLGPVAAGLGGGSSVLELIASHKKVSGIELEEREAIDLFGPVLESADHDDVILFAQVFDNLQLSDATRLALEGRVHRKQQVLMNELLEDIGEEQAQMMAENVSSDGSNAPTQATPNDTSDEAGVRSHSSVEAQEIVFYQKLEASQHLLAIASGLAVLNNKPREAQQIVAVGQGVLTACNHLHQFTTITQQAGGFTAALSCGAGLAAINPILGLASCLVGVLGAFKKSGPDPMQHYLEQIMSELRALRDLVIDFRREMDQRLDVIERQNFVMHTTLMDQFIETQGKIEALHLLSVQQFGQLDHKLNRLFADLQVLTEINLSRDFPTKCVDLETHFEGKLPITSQQTYQRYSNCFLEAARDLAVHERIVGAHQDWRDIEPIQIASNPGSYTGFLVKELKELGLLPSDTVITAMNPLILSKAIHAQLGLIQQYPKFIFIEQQQALHMMANHLEGYTQFLMILKARDNNLAKTLVQQCQSLIQSMKVSVNKAHDDFTLKEVTNRLKASLATDKKAVADYPEFILPDRREREHWRGNMHTYQWSRSRGAAPQHFAAGIGGHGGGAADAIVQFYQQIQSSYQQDRDAYLTHLMTIETRLDKHLDMPTPIIMPFVLPRPGGQPPHNQVALPIPNDFNKLKIPQLLIDAEREGLGRVRLYYNIEVHSNENRINPDVVELCFEPMGYPEQVVGQFVILPHWRNDARHPAAMSDYVMHPVSNVWLLWGKGQITVLEQHKSAGKGDRGRYQPHFRVNGNEERAIVSNFTGFVIDESVLQNVLAQVGAIREPRQNRYASQVRQNETLMQAKDAYQRYYILLKLLLQISYPTSQGETLLRDLEDCNVQSITLLEAADHAEAILQKLTRIQEAIESFPAGSTDLIDHPTLTGASIELQSAVNEINRHLQNCEVRDRMLHNVQKAYKGSIAQRQRAFPEGGPASLEIEACDSDDESQDFYDPSMRSLIIHRSFWDRSRDHEHHDLRALGQGGAAIVYPGVLVAKDGHVHDVAIKSIKANLIDSQPDLRRTFFNEVRMYQTLSDNQPPHVMQLYGITKHKNRRTGEGHWSLIMERGSSSLARYLDHCYQHEIRLSPEEQLRLCYEIAQGIAALHGNNIVHKDLKDSNILLVKRPSGYHAKISDLGLSTVRQTTLAQSQTVKDREGTLLWQAPEVVLGAKHSRTSDMFSFALIAWRIVSHGAPIGSNDEHKGLLPLDMAILHDVYKNTVLGFRLPIPDDCPPRLRQVIEGAWQAIYTLGQARSGTGGGWGQYQSRVLPIPDAKRLSAQEVVEQIAPQLERVHREFEEPHYDWFSALLPATKLRPASLGFFQPASSEQISYRATFKDEPIIFEEQTVMADGDCAFTALGVARQKALADLLSLKGDDTVRRLFREEIVGEFLTEQSYLCTEDSDLLVSAYMKAEAAYNYFMASFNRQYPELIELDDTQKLSSLPTSNHDRYLLAARIEAKEAAQHALYQYAESENVYTRYIEKGIGGSAWLSYQGIIQVARVNHLNVYVWRSDAKANTSLELACSNVVEQSTNTIHMLHTNGFTHFNLLMENNAGALKVTNKCR